MTEGLLLCPKPRSHAAFQQNTCPRFTCGGGLRRAADSQVQRAGLGGAGTRLAGQLGLFVFGVRMREAIKTSLSLQPGCFWDGSPGTRVPS